MPTCVYYYLYLKFPSFFFFFLLIRTYFTKVLTDILLYNLQIINQVDSELQKLHLEKSSKKSEIDEKV